MRADDDDAGVAGILGYLPLAGESGAKRLEPTTMMPAWQR